MKTLVQTEPKKLRPKIEWCGGGLGADKVLSAGPERKLPLFSDCTLYALVFILNRRSSFTKSNALSMLLCALVRLIDRCLVCEPFLFTRI